MAARDLTVAFRAAIIAGHVRPAILYEGEFVDSFEATQYLRLWTGVGPLTWDGKTWTGGGALLRISPIAESSSLQAIGFEVTVPGVQQDKVATGMTAVRKNRPGTVWLMLFDAAGGIILDPYLLQRGKFDTVPIDESGATCTVTFRYEDRMLDLNTAHERRYTHEDQQQRSPGDMGFSQVELLQDMNFVLPPPAG